MSTLGTMTAGGDPAALGQLLRSRRERLTPEHLRRTVATDGALFLSNALTTASR